MAHPLIGSSKAPTLQKERKEVSSLAINSNFSGDLAFRPLWASALPPIGAALAWLLESCLHPVVNGNEK